MVSRSGGTRRGRQSRTASAGPSTGKWAGPVHLEAGEHDSPPREIALPGSRLGVWRHSLDVRSLEWQMLAESSIVGGLSR